MKAEEIVRRLQLAPHPEGGYYRETYRTKHSTTIYFLLPRGHVSKIHRIQGDEIWHRYGGGSLHVIELGKRAAKDTVLDEQNPQHVVPAGVWFGAYPDPAAEYSFVGCTVAPPFTFETLEMGKRESLFEEFPFAKDLIRKLT